MAESISPKKELTVQDLINTHIYYNEKVNEWSENLAIYEGIEEVKKLGLIRKHEREPNLTYERRLKELYSFDYSKSIVEIFQFHLFKKEPKSTLGKLLKNDLWIMFQNNANLYGDDYSSTIMQISLYASIVGYMGILVDMSNAKFTTKEEQKRAEVYPYIAVYFPKAILDWSFGKDQYNKPVLEYVKLLDDDGVYRIWYRDQWELWVIPENSKSKTDKAILLNIGLNPLESKEIPFFWHYNLKSRKHGIGNSDISGVAKIDLSIIKNLSQIEQIVDMAAFPMMRKPMRHANPTEVNSPQQDDEVGVEVILEFDPEHPESKPDWLPAEVKDSVEAIVSVIDKKISEIYRAANIGGMAATEPTSNPQSGVSKKIDFQLLNSKLVGKAINLENTENKILELWCKWEKIWLENKDTAKIIRERNYDLEDITNDLDNAITSKTYVLSDKFNELIQKRIARKMLQSITEDELSIIDKEIEENIGKEQNKEDDFSDKNKDDLEYIEQGMNNNSNNKNKEDIEE